MGWCWVCAVIVCCLRSHSLRVKLLQDTELKIHTGVTGNPEKKNMWVIQGSHLAHLLGTGCRTPAPVFQRGYRKFHLRLSQLQKVRADLHGGLQQLVRAISGLSFRDHEAALRRLRICHINCFTPLAWQVQVETTQHLPAVFPRGSCSWRPVKICVTPPLKGLSPTFETAVVGRVIVFQSATSLPVLPFVCRSAGFRIRVSSITDAYKDFHRLTEKLDSFK